MTRSNLINSAIVAWIVTILLSIASGPLIKMCLSMEDYSNGLSVHKKLQDLNITTSSDFNGIENTTELFFACLKIFLGCVLGLSIILTISTIVPQVYFENIIYTAVVFLFTVAFIVLTVLSILFYVDLYNEQINPYSKTSDLHGQMTSSLKDNYWNDNFTTGTNISNEWNHLFIDFECCGVNRVSGTTNDFDQTSWCTTNGTCQATASQIPKTCCKGLTEYDYQNAPGDCHSSVNPGKYYDKGCFSVIKKEVIKERIQFNSFSEDILREGLRVILVMGSCSFLSSLGTCVFIGICVKEATPGPNNGSTANGRVEPVCPIPQTSNVSNTQGHVQPVCPTSQTINVSTTQGHAQSVCPTSQTNNELTTNGHVKKLYPNLQTNNASTAQGQVQPVCPNSQAKNGSTGPEHVQHVDSSLQTNIGSTAPAHVKPGCQTLQASNASTAPGHAQNTVSELKENNNSDSAKTEHADEKKLHTTPM